MKCDNQWHPAILYKIGETFQIAENFEEAEKDPRVTGEIEYQEIKYNWNRGQPIVDLGDGEMVTITDMDIKKL
jgi:hypothetical protein